MLRIAIIGTGGIAKAHLKGYLEQKKFCTIVAVVDIYEDKAKKFIEELSNEIEIFQNHHELLKHAQIDAISLCTPPYTHKEIAIDCLNAGVHVLCEKPMAPSVADCEAMLQAQKASGSLLSICHQNRFRNDIQEVKHVLDSGLLGKILFTRMDSFWWRSRTYYDLWWRGTWEKEGGGCVLNHAVHQLDLLLWFLGTPNSISSLCANLAHDNAEVEDFGTALLEYQNNTIAQFSTSTMCHAEDQDLVFQCEKGKIVSPWNLYCSLASNSGFVLGRDESLEKEVNQQRKQFSKLKYEKHFGAVNNFIQSILGNEELLITGNDGKKVIELITLFYASFNDNKKFSFPLGQGSEWYTTDGIMKSVKHFYEKTGSIENIDGDIVIGKSS